MNNKSVTNYLKEDKIADLEKFIEENEISSEDYFNIFLYFKNKRQFEISKKYLIKAVELDPDNLQYKLILSTICLAINDFKSGWKYYEERVMLPNYSRRNLLRWTGKEKYEKCVVFVEQGYGDTFMFARFLPLLKLHFKYITFCVSKELLSLFKKINLNIDNVVTEINPKDYDCYLDLASLPFLLNLNTEKDLNNNWNYMEKSYTEQPLNNKKLNVGFCLNGRIDTDYEKTRAIDIKKLLPLFNDKNIIMHSLYKTNNDSYQNLLKEQKIMQYDIFDDFDKTAQLIQNMDIIITSDTSIVHLAGSLGKKTFLLLPKLTDWHWKTKGEKTYWYDSLEIIRQERQGEWEEPTLILKEKINEYTKQEKNTFKNLFCSLFQK